MDSAVASDPALVAAVRRFGRFDATGCYQCGSCTVSCDLVSEFASFPRKPIRFALLGLRGPLLQSLEPWICHDCGDCSIVCPREADPRASMATLRRFLTAQYDWTGLSSKLLASRAWYVGALSVAAGIAVGLILWYHLSYVGMKLSEFATIPLGLGHMFPTMTYYTLTVVLLPVLFLMTHAGRMWWLTMHRGDGVSPSAFVYVREAWRFAYHSATHALMRRCDERARWLGHWIMAFGVVLMLAIKVFGLSWFQTDNIYPIYHPQRWLGYLGTACILFGVGAIVVGRIRKVKEFYKDTRFEDLVFPVLLLLTAVTGIAVHVFRYVGLGLTSHFTYALHVIVATPLLVVEMSFGKWSHMIYRPMALYLQAVRQRAMERAAVAEVLDHAA